MRTHNLGFSGTPAEWQGKAMFEWHRRKQSAGGIARRPQYTIELTYSGGFILSVPSEYEYV